MKALSLRQPWAQLAALGVKTVETRSWSTSYRGSLAIHAAKRRPARVWAQESPVLYDPIVMERHLDIQEDAHQPGQFAYDWIGPLGAIVATCTLVDVVPMVGADGCKNATKHLCIVNQSMLLHSRLDEPWPDGETEHVVSDQHPYGDFAPGRFAWLLADLKPLAEPIPARGRQGLWNWQAS